MTPEELAQRLEKAAARVPVVLNATVRHEGQMLLALILANASGAPGPNVITGDYISYGGPGASWQIEAKSVAGGTRVTVGTVRPQGMRLEFGFVGTDSLGRTYDQAPRPHVGPAVQQFQMRFGENVKRAVGEAIG